MAATPLNDLERKIASGARVDRADADQIVACTDLIAIGMLGEMARRRITGDEVTFGRVLDWSATAPPADAGSAGEVRIGGKPATSAEARQWVASAARVAGGKAAVTGFSLPSLLELVGHDHLALADLARALRADGLEAVADVPIDRLGDSESIVEILRALAHGGVAAPRLTVDAAEPSRRLDLVEVAAAVARELGTVKTFAPLPRTDRTDEPSTGYDDVRTVVVARVLCPDIRYIQVDWPLYGPKLAQVAIAYGANDVDGVSAADTSDLGPRRAPREEIQRQIRGAGATPVERDGRYERLA